MGKPLPSRQQMMSVLKSLDEKHCKCPFGAAGKEAEVLGFLQVLYPLPSKAFGPKDPII